MSSFFNFLKNLLSGLSSFLGGLFKSKKSQDESVEAAPKPRKASKSKSGYFLELDEAKGLGSSTPAAKTSAPSAIAAESVNGDSATASAGTTTSKRRGKSKSSTSTTPAPEPATVAAALNLPKPTVTTLFAPNYLVPTASANGRRRPGANMSSFLDMARQVKPSS